MTTHRHRRSGVIGLAAFAAAAVILAHALHAQTPPASRAPAPPATGLILGQVLDADTSRPVAGATVTLATEPPQRVLTGSDGRFLFRDLPAGRYAMTATAPAYLAGAFGQRRPAGPPQPIALDADQRLGNVEMRLWKEATLAGAVTDESGAPVVGISVWIMRRDARAFASARTDDRGAFQFVGLAPGEYLVSVPNRVTQLPAAIAEADAPTLQALRSSGVSAIASGIAGLGPAVRVGDVVVQTSAEGSYGGSNALAAVLPTVLRPDGTVVGYTTTFHPSATSVTDAAPVLLKSGDARAGINVQLRPLPLTRISGTVTGPNGAEPNLAVHLLPAYAANQILERQHEMGITVTNVGGAFSFFGVPPGSYVLKAWRLPQILVIGRDALPPDTSVWAEAPIVVGSSPPPPVALTLRPGVSVSGRVVYDGAAPPVVAQTMQTVLSVAFEPESWPLAFGARMATRVGATGEFATQGLPPGRYVPRLPNQFLPPARGWFFESAVQGGRDLMMTPLMLESANIADVVITLTDKRTELSGAIQDLSGQPAKNATVILFPANYRTWLDNGTLAAGARIEPASQAGSYSITDVRPGEYLIAAVHDDALANWPQPAAVSAIAATADRVTIARGDVKRLDVRMKR